MDEGEVVEGEEAGNLHDERAVVVKIAGGAMIGHLPREHWLKRVIFDKDSSARAEICALHPGRLIAVALSATVKSGGRQRFAPNSSQRASGGRKELACATVELLASS